MAIGTSNVGLLQIANEFGASTSNISQQTMGTQQVLINPGNSRQTYTLTDSITLTTEDSTVSDNTNMTSSSNVELSEFKSYTQANPVQFSSSSGSSNKVETVNHDQGTVTGNCAALVRLSGSIYAKRVGNDCVWYIARGQNTFGTHRKEGTTFTSDTEIARLAGVGSSTNVSVSVSTLEQTAPNFSGSSSAVSTGSTNSSLSSTNTKIGFEMRVVGQVESFGSARDVRYRFQMDFVVTAPSKRPRTFRFFVKLFGNYNATAPEIC